MPFQQLTDAFAACNILLQFLHEIPRTDYTGMRISAVTAIQNEILEATADDFTKPNGVEKDDTCPNLVRHCRQP